MCMCIYGEWNVKDPKVWSFEIFKVKLWAIVNEVAGDADPPGESPVPVEK